jgi:DNA-binding CsgD family transcriptional regulator/pimeloyl-ACP methyl ester carboxylesterase
MGPQIQFATAADGTRVGFGLLGNGPPTMVLLSWGISFESEWENPHSRAMYEDLAGRRTVIVVSRRGFSPSQREVADISLEAQVSDIEAVADSLKLDSFDLWAYLDATGPAVAFTVAHPQRVSRLMLWQVFVRGTEVVEERAARSIIDLIRANWTLARRTFANMSIPSGPPEQQDWMARQWRESIDSEMAARYFEFLLDLDLSDLLPRVAVPTLVMHRRGVRVVPLAAVRDAAALIPKARFVTIEGDVAYAWLGDTSYVATVEAFMDDGREARPRAPAPTNPDRLSEREIEVLRLLAQGKTNQEIADALVISLNTVSHHVTNILNKATLSNRTEAAAYAYRTGLV